MIFLRFLDLEKFSEFNLEIMNSPRQKWWFLIPDSLFRSIDLGKFASEFRSIIEILSIKTRYRQIVEILQRIWNVRLLKDYLYVTYSL